MFTGLNDPALKSLWISPRTAMEFSAHTRRLGEHSDNRTSHSFEGGPTGVPKAGTNLQAVSMCERDGELLVSIGALSWDGKSTGTGNIPTDSYKKPDNNLSP